MASERGRVRLVARVYWVSGVFTTKGKKTVVLGSSFETLKQEAWLIRITGSSPYTIRAELRMRKFRLSSVRSAGISQPS
jgi:hypothetical protein